MNEQNSPLLKEKGIVGGIILSFVTFGIYYFVWTYSIMKKIKLLAGEEPKCGGELALFIFIPFYFIYWMYSRSKRLAEADVARGILLEDKSVLNLIISLVGCGAISIALMQSDLNKVARALQAA
jgi:hypothetical protein